jgi:hypothetical protein
MEVNMEIVKNEIRNIDGVDYQYIEYDKTLPNGTPYSVTTRIPTAAELSQQEYETERQKVVDDVKTINDSILIGEATEADKQARLDQWTALKLEKGWV